MDWEAFVAISQLVGALFVGVSLIYVALQLHHTVHQRRTEALGSALGVHVTQIAHMTQTAEAASLFRKFVRGLDEMTLDERGMIMSVMLERLVSFNQVINFHRAGLLGDDEFQAMQGTVISILRTRGGRQWWSAYKHMTPTWIQAFVTKAIDDPRITCKPYDEELPWLFVEGPAQAGPRPA